MLFFRKVVFYILVLIYLVFCPLIIMYALGYIVKPEAKNPIVGTGDIFIATMPQGAIIYVNDKIQDNKTPALLDKLLPGEYNIKLFMEDYLLWNESFLVKAGKAVSLDKIVLIPKKWDAAQVSESIFTDIEPIPGTQFIICVQGPTVGDYFVYDYNADKLFPVAEEDKAYLKYKVITTYTQANSPRLIIHAGFENKDRYLLFDIKSVNTELTDITPLLTGKPIWLFWSADNQNNIFALYSDKEKGNYLNRVDISKEAIYPDYATDIIGAGIYNGSVYIIKSDYTVECMSYDKKSEKHILADPKLGRSLFSDGKGYFAIKPFVKGIILFIDREGRLMANRLPYTFVDKGVKGVRFDAANERVLLWQADKIGVLDFSVETTGQVNFETGPNLEWVHRDGTAIEDAYWAYNGSHVIFTDSGMSFILELESFGEPNINKIVPVKNGSSIFYSEEKGNLYYIDPKESALTSVDLIPAKQLVQIQKQ